jgi:hypothetical protein
MTYVNPLRDERDRRLPRIAGPCGMVLFGVTGDLSRKKIMPAIYDLANRGLLPPGFSLVGFARRDWADQDFAQIVHDSVKQYARTEFREEVWKQLSEGFRFVQGDFDDDEAFEHLRQTIDELDRTRGTEGNHRPFGAARHGAAHMGQRSGARAGRQDELGQARQVGVVFGQRFVEQRHRLGLEQFKTGNGQLAAQVEELVLHLHQQLAHASRQFFAEQHADVRVQFVDVAHGMNTQAVLGHACVVAQAGGAVVAGAGCDL